MSETSAPVLRRFQCSLRALLLAPVLLGAGISCLLRQPTPDRVFDWQDAWAFFQLLMAFPLLGAGLLVPFGRARLGAYLGFLGFAVFAFTHDIQRSGFQVVWRTSSMMVAFWLTVLAVSLLGSSAVRWNWQRKARKQATEPGPSLDVGSPGCVE